MCFTEVYEVDAGRTCMCVLQRSMKLMRVVMSVMSLATCSIWFLSPATHNMMEHELVTEHGHGDVLCEH